MRKAALVPWVLPALALAAAGGRPGFKPYPGAAVDQKASKESREAAGVDVTIYTTRDSFDKVYAFYRSIGKEYRMPSPEAPARLRSGSTLQEAYFIFDGAVDIMASKAWIKVQRPYLGRPKDVPPAGAKFADDMYEDVRDVTVIVAMGK